MVFFLIVLDFQHGWPCHLKTKTVLFLLPPSAYLLFPFLVLLYQLYFQYNTECIIFLLNSLLRYNWHIIKFTHCKWTVQWFLIYAYSFNHHQNPVLEYFYLPKFPSALFFKTWLIYWVIIECSELVRF